MQVPIETSGVTATYETFFGLTGSQWGSIAAVVISVVMLVRFARRPLPEKEPAPAGGGSPDGEERTTDFTPPPEPGTGERRDR